MKKDLDEMLCAAYPQLFVNRHADMQTTAMCWGFECGDGWYNIINNLCGNIQSHLDHAQKQRESAIKYNAMATQCKNGIFDLFDEEYKKFTSQTFKDDRLNDIIQDDFRTVPDAVQQVVVLQVKEKFGTLRFYYSGGDDYIRGLTSMAESMSGVTCETCGNPGRRVGGGWITTLCKEHAEARGIYDHDEEQKEIEQ
jgi:hypothetical protein